MARRVSPRPQRAEKRVSLQAAGTKPVWNLSRSFQIPSGPPGLREAGITRLWPAQSQGPSGDSRGHGAHLQEALVTSTRTTHDLPAWSGGAGHMGTRFAGVTQGPRGRGDKKDSVTRCGMLARPPHGERERKRERAPWDCGGSLESHLYSQLWACPALSSHWPAGPTPTGGAPFPGQACDPHGVPPSRCCQPTRRHSK